MHPRVRAGLHEATLQAGQEDDPRVFPRSQHLGRTPRLCDRPGWMIGGSASHISLTKTDH